MLITPLVERVALTQVFNEARLMLGVLFALSLLTLALPLESGGRVGGHRSIAR